MNESINFDLNAPYSDWRLIRLLREDGEGTGPDELAGLVVQWQGDINEDQNLLVTLGDGFKELAHELRGHGYQVSAYALWRAMPVANPRNRAAGSVGATTAIANMNRQQRRERARKGGNKVFHGDVEGTDGVRASARGRLLARKRWKE